MPYGCYVTCDRGEVGIRVGSIAHHESDLPAAGPAGIQPEGGLMMIHPATRAKALGRRAAVVVLVVLCSASVAAAASAATLHISVPSTVTKGKGYNIKLTGTFSKSEVPHRAFLISVIQYSPQACKATAQEENTLTKVAQFYFGKKGGIFERQSPFQRTDIFTAKAVGRRRVCSYLYAQQVGPRSTTPPIAKASKPYSVTAK
jgi:hypothetical protein